MRAPMSRRCARASRSTPAASSSRSPPTTATCCTTCATPASRASASSRRRAPRPRRARSGIEIVERFFGVALAQELAAAGRQADLVAANNVLAHVPDINDFVARLRGAAQARRRRDLRVPAPAAAGRREPVRHRLPRALLLPVADRGRARLRAQRPARSSTSRSCRRTAAACASSRSAPTPAGAAIERRGASACSTTRSRPA